MTANTMELSDVRKLVKTYLRVSIAFDIGVGEETHNTQYQENDVNPGYFGHFKDLIVMTGTSHITK